MQYPRLDPAMRERIGDMFRNANRHTRALRRPVPALLGSAALLVASVGTATLLNQSPEPASAHVDVAAGAATLSPAPAEATVPPAPAVPDPILTAPAEKVLDYDFQFQPNYYYCGPASTRIALSTQMSAPSQGEIADRLGTTINGTNSVLDTTRGLNSLLGKDVYQAHFIPGQKATEAEIRQMRSDVVQALSNGRGVVANIVGGATDGVGVYHEFSGGHYIALVGYKQHGDAVLVADPSGMFGPRTYWMETQAIANWAATRGYSA